MIVSILNWLVKVVITVLFTILDLTANLIGCVFFNWWVVLFAVETTTSNKGVEYTGMKLPWIFRWLDTFDADLDQGVRDGTIKGNSVYWNRVKWLYRNPTYGFSYYFLGITFDSTQWTQLEYTEGDPVTGFGFTYRASGPGIFYNIHCIRKLPFLNVGVRLKMGWKAWNMRDPGSPTGWAPVPWGPIWRVPFVFSISKAG